MGRARVIAAAAALAAAALLTHGGGVRAEIVQRDGVRIAFIAKLAPSTLPREGAAPVALTLGGRIAAVGSPAPPPLRRIEIAVNRSGRLDLRGLRPCALGQIQYATNAAALRECGDSLLGEGRFAARLLIADQAPFPSRGRVLAFYGRHRGRPAILAHVYGTDPIPTSYTLPFLLGRGSGRYGTTLTSVLDPSLSNYGYITYLRMTLGGGRTGRLRAGCPAPRGLSGGAFALARLRFEFQGTSVDTTVVRSCRVR